MDLDGWVRHRATLMAASDAVPPAELRPPPLAFAASPPLPGLSRLSAKVILSLCHIPGAAVAYLVPGSLQQYDVYILILIVYSW